jgi:hypothetical protein
MRALSQGARLPFLAALTSLVLCATVFACDDETVATPGSPDRPYSAQAAVGDSAPPPSPVTSSDASPASEEPGQEVELPLTLAITSPPNGAVIALPPSGLLAVTYQTNLEMQKPKSCAQKGKSKRCGHAHVTIDGVACNAPRPSPDGGAGKQTYNVTAEEPTSSFADFSFCPQPIDGTHVIELELRQDNHAPLNPVVKQSVTVTVTTPDGGFIRDAGAD